jgi:hypothetical protein
VGLIFMPRLVAAQLAAAAAELGDEVDVAGDGGVVLPPQRADGILVQLWMCRTDLIFNDTRGRAKIINVISQIDRPGNGLVGELPQTRHQPFSGLSPEFPFHGLWALMWPRQAAAAYVNDDSTAKLRIHHADHHLAIYPYSGLSGAPVQEAL